MLAYSTRAQTSLDTASSKILSHSAQLSSSPTTLPSRRIARVLRKSSTCDAQIEQRPSSKRSMGRRRAHTLRATPSRNNHAMWACTPIFSLSSPLLFTPPAPPALALRAKHSSYPSSSSSRAPSNPCHTALPEAVTPRTTRPARPLRSPSSVSPGSLPAPPHSQLPRCPTSTGHRSPAVFASPLAQGKVTWSGVFFVLGFPAVAWQRHQSEFATLWTLTRRQTERAGLNPRSGGGEEGVPSRQDYLAK